MLPSGIDGDGPDAHVLNRLEKGWLADRVGASDAEAAAGAVPGRVHLALGSHGEKSLLTTHQLK